MSRTHITMQTSHISCGVLEVGRLLESPEASAWEVANRFYHPANGSPEAFIMLSDVVPEGKKSRAAEFVQCMKSNSWGMPITCKSVDFQPTTAINPRTGNIIAVHVIRVAHEQFKDWYKHEAIKRLQRRV